MSLLRSHTKRPAPTDAGFTLTELLITIVIMAIIAGIGGANYLTSLKRGNDGKRAADLNNLRNALEMYYLDQSSPSYPDPDPTLDLASSAWFIVNETNLGSLTPDYIKDFPSDPKSGQNYLFKSGGSCYCLSAEMEVSDPRTSIGGCTSCPAAHSRCYLVTCP